MKNHQIWQKFGKNKDNLCSIHCLQVKKISCPLEELLNGMKKAENYQMMDFGTKQTLMIPAILLIRLQMAVFFIRIFKKMKFCEFSAEIYAGHSGPENFKKSRQKKTREMK